MQLALIVMSGAAIDARGAVLARATGSGVLFPTLNHSMQMNPAGLSEGGGVNIQGLMDLETQNLFGSATFGQNQLGAGFSYLRFSEEAIPINSVESFGFGFKLGQSRWGGSVHSQEFDSFSADVGMIYDMRRIRLGAVARSVNDGFSAIDGGIGVNMGMWGAEFDLRYPMHEGSSSNDMSFQAGFFAMMRSLSFSLTYGFDRIRGIGDGDIGLGISLGLNRTVFAEAFYDSSPLAGSGGNWSLGARIAL